MLFADLDKLKIIKTYNYNKESIVIGDESLLQGTLAQIGFAAKNASQELLSSTPAIECVYEFVIAGDGVATEDEAADFLVVVNVIIGQFFNCFTTAEPRDRQYRLDVAPKLKTLKMNFGTLKKAINNKTVADKFNLIVKYKDLVFMLVDEKTTEPSETATDDVEASHEED